MTEFERQQETAQLGANHITTDIFSEIQRIIAESYIFDKAPEDIEKMGDFLSSLRERISEKGVQFEQAHWACWARFGEFFDTSDYTDINFCLVDTRSYKYPIAIEAFSVGKDQGRFSSIILRISPEIYKIQQEQDRIDGQIDSYTHIRDRLRNSGLEQQSSDEVAKALAKLQRPSIGTDGQVYHVGSNSDTTCISLIYGSFLDINLAELRIHKGDIRYTVDFNQERTEYSKQGVVQKSEIDQLDIGHIKYFSHHLLSISDKLLDELKQTERLCERFIEKIDIN